MTMAKNGYKPMEEKKERGIVTTFCGKREFIDRKTGEIVEMEMMEKKVKHGLKRGWRRVYLENFMEILTGLYSAGRKIDVIDFILENLDSNNKFTLTQCQVVEQTKISKPIVIQTYRYLTDCDFWRKDGTCYIVNTNFVCAFGSDKKNAIIATRYSELDPTLPNIED